jgi:hypothetical protein
MVLQHQKFSMAKNQDSEKRRGRPEVDSEPITVRVERDRITAIDNAMRDIPEIPSRPHILRIALDFWLRAKGYLK